MTYPGAIDLSDPFAPIYWGFVISLLLGGITIVQAYIYFPATNDPPIVRWTAVSMIILDLTSSALMAQSVYHYLIPNYGSLEPLSSATPEISTECLLSAIITFNSQMYFVYQLYAVGRLGKTRSAVVAVITVCAILAFAGGVACVVAMYIHHRGVLSNRNYVFAIGFGLAKGLGALTDILATIAMCVYLTSSKTGMTQTSMLLHKLVLLIIHRGVLVTLIQTLLLVTFYAAPKHLYWMAFHINVTKLYANTFFAMLNGRQHLKERLKESMLTNSFASTRSRDTRGFHSENYGLHHVEAQSNDGTRSTDMPTVTKTVVIADM